MVLELTSGKFVALEIGADNPNTNVYKDFRQLCGPSDPVRFLLAFLDWEINRFYKFWVSFWQVVARQLYPKSIRGKFGVNKVQNAIHCTDLVEDCKLEVEYFFKILTPWLNEGSNWYVHVR